MCAAEGAELRRDDAEDVVRAADRHRLLRHCDAVRARIVFSYGAEGAPFTATAFARRMNVEER